MILTINSVKENIIKYKNNFGKNPGIYKKVNIYYQYWIIVCNHLNKYKHSKDSKELGINYNAHFGQDYYKALGKKD